MGWKETVRMNPGEVTTVIMKFDLPKVPFTVSPSISADRGINGNEYVWHCHILEARGARHDAAAGCGRPEPIGGLPSITVRAKKSTATFTIYNGTPPYTITVADKQMTRSSLQFPRQSARAVGHSRWTSKRAHPLTTT